MATLHDHGRLALKISEHMRKNKENVRTFSARIGVKYQSLYGLLNAYKRGRKYGHLKQEMAEGLWMELGDELEGSLDRPKVEYGKFSFEEDKTPTIEEQPTIETQQEEAEKQVGFTSYTDVLDAEPSTQQLLLEILKRTTMIDRKLITLMDMIDQEKTADISPNKKRGLPSFFKS